MKCPFCKKEVIDSEAFCASCGKQLPADRAADKPKKPKSVNVVLTILIGAITILVVTVVILLSGALEDMMSRNSDASISATDGGGSPADASAAQGAQASTDGGANAALSSSQDGNSSATSTESTTTATSAATTTATTTTTATITATATTSAATTTTTVAPPTTTDTAATTEAPSSTDSSNGVPGGTAGSANGDIDYEKMYTAIVANIGEIEVLEYEFIYEMNYSYQYTELYMYPEDLIAQMSMDSIAKRVILEAIAKEQGLFLTPEMIDYVQQNSDYIDEIAASYSSETDEPLTGDDYTRQALGITKNQYLSILESIVLANYYLETEFNQMFISDDEAEAYYESNIESYLAASVRHILFLYETSDADGNWRAQEDSERLANETVERINSGEDMIELVMELSEDTYLDNGGLYTFTKTDNFEQGFIDWAFAQDRKIGDVGICETAYGYHVMRLEDMAAAPFEDIKENIIGQMKSDDIDALILELESDPRFEIQIVQDVYAAAINQVFSPNTPDE